MGNAIEEQGKLDEAIGAYNRALAIKPDYAEAYSGQYSPRARQARRSNRGLQQSPFYQLC